MATRARPCDSPAVSQRNMSRSSHGPVCAGQSRRPSLPAALHHGYFDAAPQPLARGGQQGVRRPPHRRTGRGRVAPGRDRDLEREVSPARRGRHAGALPGRASQASTGQASTIQASTIQGRPGRC